jgi:hypothetical protein
MAAAEQHHTRQGDTMPGLHIPRTRALVEALLRLPVDGVAVGVGAGPDTAELVYSSDPVGSALDNLQFILGEGPCVDAFRQGRPVLVPDLDDPTVVHRWPWFTRDAVAAGAAATFAFPLHIGATPFGTVELYRHTPGPLTGPNLLTAALLTDDLTRTVLDELAGPGHLEPTPSNPEPQFGRTEIPQATGMIAAQLGISIPQALARLRAAAFTADRPVRHLAQDIIDRRLTLTDPPDAPHPPL